MTNQIYLILPKIITLRK